MRKRGQGETSSLKGSSRSGKATGLLSFSKAPAEKSETRC